MSHRRSRFTGSRAALLATLATLALTALLVPPTVASGQDFGVALHLGTLGFGADVAVSVRPDVTFRAGGNISPGDFSFEEEGVDVTVDPPTPHFTLVGDYYPSGTFRITAGLLIAPGDLELAGRPIEPVEIGDAVYTPQEIGRLTGAIATNPVAPYIGIGVGNPTRSRMGFFMDLGVAFHGRPELRVEADGPIASDPAFRADLQAEVADRQDDLDGWVVYPVLSLGMSFRLGGPGAHASRTPGP